MVFLPFILHLNLALAARHRNFNTHPDGFMTLSFLCCTSSPISALFQGSDFFCEVCSFPLPGGSACHARLPCGPGVRSGDPCHCVSGCAAARQVCCRKRLASGHVTRERSAPPSAPAARGRRGEAASPFSLAPIRRDAPRCSQRWCGLTETSTEEEDNVTELV